MAKKSRQKFLNKFKKIVQDKKSEEIKILEKVERAKTENNTLTLTGLDLNERTLFYNRLEVKDDLVQYNINKVKNKYVYFKYNELWADTMFKFRLLRFFKLEDLQEFIKIENIKKYENEFRLLETYVETKKITIINNLFLGQTLEENPKIDEKTLKKLLKINVTEVANKIVENQDIVDVIFESIYLMNLCLEFQFSPILAQMLICKNLVACNVVPIVAYDFSERLVLNSTSNQMFRFFNKDAKHFDVTKVVNILLQELLNMVEIHTENEPINQEQADQFNNLLNSIKPKNDLKLKIVALLYIYYAKSFRIEEIEAYLNSQIRFIKPHLDSLSELGMISNKNSEYKFNKDYLYKIIY